MAKYSTLTLLSTLILLSNPLYALPTATNKQNHNQPIEHLDGYSLGLYISKYYQTEKKAQFLKGFQEALNTTVPLEDLKNINKLKNKWLSQSNLSEEKKYAYAYGYLAVIEPKLNNFSFDHLTYIQGIVDAVNNPESDYLTIDTAQIITKNFNKNKVKQYKKDMISLHSKNVEKGKAFLDANAKKENIVTMDSGLQYKVIEAGEGKNPKPTEQVTLNVVGMKINGDVFYDSKQESPNTIKIKLSTSLPAWKQAISKMSTAAIWEIYVPSNLAYGHTGWKDIIKPGETLIYKIELLSIEKN